MHKSCQSRLSWAGDESWRAGSRPVAQAVWEEHLHEAPLCGGCQTGANMSKPCQLLLPPKKKCLPMGCVGSWSWKGLGGKRERVQELRGAQAWGGETQGMAFQTPNPFFLLSPCPLAMQLLPLFQCENPLLLLSQLMTHNMIYVFLTQKTPI